MQMGDDQTLTRIGSKAWRELGSGKWEVMMSRAPMGLKNRCRIVQMIYDIEKLDEIEAKDPTVEDGELVEPHKLASRG